VKFFRSSEHQNFFGRIEPAHRRLRDAMVIFRGSPMSEAVARRSSLDVARLVTA
jgi:hypothetical protein